MADTLLFSQPGSLPLARRIPVPELPGRFRKWLEVPPGRLGVLVAEHRPAKTYPPGRHCVLSAWQRLRGQGAVVHVGYIPAEPFRAWLSASNLLSGDGELMEAHLLCRVSVADPGRFFIEQVLPRGEIPAGLFDLNDSMLVVNLAALARRYAASDLVFGLPTTHLLPEVQAALEPVLESAGLQLEALQSLAFRRAADRVLAAEKLLALEERLQDVQVQQQMLAAESQAQLDDFLAQLVPEARQKTGLRVVAPAVEAERVSRATPSAGGQAKAGATTVSAATVAVQAERQATQATQTTNLMQRIRQFFGRFNQPAPTVEAVKELQKENPAKLRRWLLGRLMWLGFLLVVAGGISWAVIYFGRFVPAEVITNWLLILWAPVALFLIESMVSFLKQREKLQQALWQGPGITYLDDLAGKDRQRMDELVRRECGRELMQARNILNEIRSRVYRQGAEDLSLRLRQLEHKVESGAVRVKDPQFGSPAYLARVDGSKLKIPSQAWLDMIDYDESLIVAASGLSDLAQQLQQELVGADAPPAALDPFENRLDTFLHRFETRSRVLKTA